MAFADFLKTFDPLHRRGLAGVRGATAFMLTGRDKAAPVMAEIRQLPILPHLPVSARLFVPDNARERGPALLFFHGGGFVLNGIDSNQGLCRRLAHAAGMRVILATYRLAPEHAYPAQMEDADAITRWIFDHAAELGADPDRMALGGDSVGAYLAISLTRRLNAETPGRVKAQALFYPLLQLDDRTWAADGLKGSRILGRMAVAYINAQFPVERPPSLLDGAPAEGGAPPPPTLITVGGVLDPVRPDVLVYAQALAAADAKVTLFEQPRLPHGFGNLTHASEDARRALFEMGQALGREMGSL
jgi:acetyl esterase